jgi:hypothetical protein
MTLSIFGKFDFADKQITGKDVLALPASKAASYYKISSVVDDEGNVTLNAYSSKSFQCVNEDIQAFVSGKCYPLEEGVTKNGKPFIKFTVCISKKTYVNCRAYGANYERIKGLFDKFGASAFDIVNVTGLFSYTASPSNDKKYLNVLVNSFDVLRWVQSGETPVSATTAAEAAPPCDLPDGAPEAIAKVVDTEWATPEF